MKENQMQVELNITELSDLLMAIREHQGKWIDGRLHEKIRTSLDKEVKNLVEINKRVMEDLQIELVEKIRTHLMGGGKIEDCRHFLDKYQENLRTLENEILSWESKLLISY